MLEFITLLTSVLVAFVLSFALGRLLIITGPHDAPDGGRKDHARAIPTSGGLAVALAMAIALWTAPPPVFPPTLVAGAAGALALLAIGFADDVMDLPASLKLAAQIAVAAGVAVAGLRADVLAPGFDRVRDLPPAIACFVAIVWLVVVVNAVNFMDGANGLAMGMAAFAALGLGAASALAGAPELVFACGALLGGLLGFLVWNVSGRLFAGDAGALFVGLALGAVSLLLVRARPDMMFVPLIVLSPFLVDVMLTLLWRAQRGARLFEAHRDHVYQIALKAGLKHWQMSMAHAVFAANCAALGFAAAAIGGEAGLVIFIGVALMSAWVHVRIRRAALAAGLIG